MLPVPQTGNNKQSELVSVTHRHY